MNPLNFLDTNYTTSESTLFIFNTSLSTHYPRLSIFEILYSISFTISNICDITFTSYGNFPNSHLSCVDSFLSHVNFYTFIQDGFDFTLLFFPFLVFCGRFLKLC